MNQRRFNLSILALALVGFSYTGKTSKSIDLQEALSNVSFSKTISASASTSSGESTPSEPDAASSRSSSIGSEHDTNTAEDMDRVFLKQPVPTHDVLMEAMDNISREKKGEKERLLALYEKAKLEGEEGSESQYDLGCAFLREKEYAPLSLYWMEKAATNPTHPHVDALTTIGRHYEYGLEGFTGKDPDKALDYYKRAWKAFKEEGYYESPFECGAVRRFIMLKITLTQHTDHPHSLFESVTSSNFFIDHEKEILEDNAFIEELERGPNSRPTS